MVVVTLGVSVVLFISERNTIIEEMKQRRIAMIDDLANMAKNSLMWKDDLVVLNYINMLKKNSDVVYALLSDKKGMILAHTDSSLIGTVAQENIKNQLIACDRLCMNISMCSGKKILEMTAPVMTKNSVMGAVRIGFSQAELNKMIRKALAKHGGNISQAAKELGLTRTSLYRRLEKYYL